MDTKNLNETQLKQMEVNIVRFNLLMEKAYNGRLTIHKEVCGFTMLPPSNARTFTSIIFHGYPVARVYANDKIEIITFNKLVWGNMKFKYDVLCDVVNEITGKEDEPIEEPVVKKKPTKRKKPVRRKAVKK